MKKIVRRENETLENLLKRYKRARARENLPAELIKRQAAMKPGERRREKHRKALRRN